MKEIPLTKGFVTLVDDSDFDELNQVKWTFGKGYAVRGVKPQGKSIVIYMHRVILSTPNGMFTDHIDHNRLNNQRENLRIVTKQQNAMNIKKKAVSSSRFKGVSAQISGNYKCYTANICPSGRHFSKIFPYTPEGEIAAAGWYNEQAKKLFGEFALLNEL